MRGVSNFSRIRVLVDGRVDHGEGRGALGVAGLRLGVLRVDADFADALRRVDFRLGGDSIRFAHAILPSNSFCRVSSAANASRSLCPGLVILYWGT